MWDIQKHLRPNEKVLYLTSPSLTGILAENAASIILMLIVLFFIGYLINLNLLDGLFVLPLTIIIIAIPLYAAIAIPLLMLSTKYAITSARIIQREGILAEDFKSASFNQLRGVSEHQTFLGQFFDYGTIIVDTQASKSEFQLQHVHHSVEFAKRLQQLVK